MQAKLIVAFDRLTEVDFLEKSGTIVAAITSNINYPAPWLVQIPTLAILTTAHTDYELAYHAALTKDILKISARESHRLALSNMLKQLAPYFELIAQGSIPKLQTTGYDLRHDTTPNSGVDPLPAPAGFRVSHGVMSGTLDVKVDRLEGAASYEIQLSESDPFVEENWEHALSSKNASHMQLTRLVPSHAYWLRLRAIGTNGVGVWTDPIHVIVV